MYSLKNQVAKYLKEHSNRSYILFPKQASSYSSVSYWHPKIIQISA